MKTFCQSNGSMFSEEELFENTPFYAKIAKMTRKGYLYDVIFKTCGHLDQTENYETTSHVYLYKGSK